MSPTSDERPLEARIDARLHAQIVSRRPLLLDDGADEACDRLAFVRAASGMAWIGERLAIVQDDVAFLAIIEGERVRAVPLPRGPGGRRRFETALGNKLDKYDFESCFAVEGADGPRLFAFGSGPNVNRRHVAILDADRGVARLVLAERLYENLRAACGLPEHLLNIEGALVRGEEACFLQRGNRWHPSAIVSVPLGALNTWLEDGAEGPAPSVSGIVRHDLGRTNGVAYGFTDGTTLADGRIVFLAAAEDTDDPIADGVVLGMRIGVVAGAAAHMCELLDESGRPATIKAEGLAVDRVSPARLWLVTDADDATLPAELIEVCWGGFDALEGVTHRA